MSHTPDTPDSEWIRALCVRVGGQCEAARRMRVDPRTVRRWCAGTAPIPWVAADWLRQYAERLPR